jgi:energy-coupling factor transport system substrate-specific component
MNIKQEQELIIRKPALLMVLLVGVGVNLAGFYLVDIFGLPLFLDSIGTFLSAVVLGPWFGAACGLFSNLLLGLINNPVMIPFALVNIVLGFIVGSMSHRYGFSKPLPFAAIVLASSLVGAALGTVIAVFVFGGISGSIIDALVAGLLAGGREIFSAAFLVRLPINILDKLISALLVLGAIRLIPGSWKDHLE